MGTIGPIFETVYNLTRLDKIISLTVLDATKTLTAVVRPLFLRGAVQAAIAQFG